MNPASAAAWAERASATDLQLRIAQLDRLALAASPAYLREVEDIAHDTVTELRSLRTVELERLRQVDPGAAAALARSAGRTGALILSTLAAAGAFGFYFSRADFDSAAVLPWAAGLLALSTASLAAALLPLRRSTPPTSGIVAISWLTVVLGVATLAGAGWILGGDPSFIAAYVVGGAAVVGSAALAVATMVARMGLDSKARAAQDGRLAAFRDELGVAATSVVERSGVRLQAAFGRLDESERAHLRAELAEAYRVLERRSLLAADVEPPMPGLLLVGRMAVVGAASIGANGVPPLVD
jgi:hypothetical protein